MKRTTLILLVAVMTLAIPAVHAQTPARMLEKGVFAEETKGDIDAAIKIYTQIVDNADANRKYVAQAHYRLGACLIKQKQYAEATPVLRDFIAKFPKETKLVAQAKKRLRKIRSQITGAELAKIVTEAVMTISTCAETDPRVKPALESLVGMNETAVVKALTKHFDSDKNTVRRSAVYILWKGDFEKITGAEAGLTKLCKHKEGMTRGMAAITLGGRKVASSFQTICEMTLKDKSPYARRCAAYALGLLGDPRARPVLEKALKDAGEFVSSNAESALSMLNSQARLPADVIKYIIDIHMETYKKAQAKGMRVNSHIYGVDDQFNLHFGGLNIVKNKTAKVINDEIALGTFSYDDLDVMNETAAAQKIRFVDSKSSRGGRYRLMWTPDKPIKPGEVRTLGWKKKATTKLTKAADGYQLKMHNHFGTPVQESFFLVVPPNVTIAKQSTDFATRKRVGVFDIYHWQRTVPPGTTNRVDLVLKKTESASQADGKLLLSYVDDSAESKRSIAGSGHAVAFAHGGVVQAVRIFASRYGSPKAPDENFSVYLLDDKQKMISEFKFPYSMIERGDMKWYTLKIKPTFAKPGFYAALSFSPTRTKGVYLGLDSSVKKSHSYTGLPGKGFKAFSGNMDWMVRVDLVSAGGDTDGQAAGPKASKHLANRAWYLWNQRKLEESEKLFKQAIDKDPKNSNAWNGLGWALQNQGKKEATDAFKKCLALEPKNAGALNGMGWIAKGLGNEDEAIMWWQKSVQADQNSTAALRGMAITLMARGQYHHAAVCYAAWVRVDPSNQKIKAELDDAMAKAKVALEETKKAHEAVKKWLALLDEGKYAETWDESAGLFRKASAKKQWIATLKGLLGSLGKMKSRTRQDADYRTSLPGSPEGEYVIFTFKTVYAKKPATIETVTPMRDKDGKWRVSGYYIK
jgi:tetratricopeptide (TPR) repeat protein